MAEHAARFAGDVALHKAFERRAAIRPGAQRGNACRARRRRPRRRSGAACGRGVSAHTRTSLPSGPLGTGGRAMRAGRLGTLAHGLRHLRRAPDLAALRAARSPDELARLALVPAARNLGIAIGFLPAELRAEAAAALLACRVLDAYEDLLDRRPAVEAVPSATAKPSTWHWPSASMTSERCSQHCPTPVGNGSATCWSTSVA